MPCKIVSMLVNADQAGDDVVGVSQLADLGFHNLALLCEVDILLQKGVLQDQSTFLVIAARFGLLGGSETEDGCDEVVPSLADEGASCCSPIRAGVTPLFLVCGSLDACSHGHTLPVDEGTQCGKTEDPSEDFECNHKRVVQTLLPNELRSSFDCANSGGLGRSNRLASQCRWAR